MGARKPRTQGKGDAWRCNHEQYVLGMSRIQKTPVSQAPGAVTHRKNNFTRITYK